MWFPSWFDSFESFAMSAGCVLLFACLLALVGIKESLRELKDGLHGRTEGEREEGADGAADDESE